MHPWEVIEFFDAIKEEFGVEIPDGEMKAMATVGAVVSFIRRALEAQRGAS